MSRTLRPPAPIRVAARVAATDTDTPALVTVPNVELLEVGENWATSTGIFTWSVEHLQAAVAAQSDPSIRTPVIKLGHTDPRFDGQPALGRIENLRLSNNNQTLVGDLVGVPAWLAKCMPSAFPRRSIEGYFDFPSRTGNTWAFALTGVALLGEAYPAIDTLADVQAWFGSEPPVFVPVAENEQIIARDPDDAMQIAVPANDAVLVAAMRRAEAADVGNTTTCGTCGHAGSFHNDTADGDNTGACAADGCDCGAMVTDAAAGAPRRVAADTSVSDVINAFYDDGPGSEPGNFWWWIREVRVDPSEVIVDDDEGHLFRVPYSIGAGDGAASVSFGEPQEVRIQYVNVAAAGQTVAAKYGNPVQAGRPKQRPRDVAAESETSPTHGGRDMTLTDDDLRALGLEPGASDDDIRAAITAMAERAAGTGTGTGEGTEGESTGTGTDTGEGTEGEGGTGDGSTTTPAVPEGMALVDAAALAELRESVSELRRDREERAAAARVAVVDAAIRDGKIAKGRRDHFVSRMEIDPEGTAAWLAAAEPVLPMQERGYAGDRPGGGLDVDAASDANQYPETWRPLATKARAQAGNRIKVGKD